MLNIQKLTPVKTIDMAEEITLDNSVIPIDDFTYILHYLHSGIDIAISDVSRYKNVLILIDKLFAKESCRENFAKKYIESVKASDWRNKKLNTVKRELVSFIDTGNHAQRLTKVESVRIQRHSYRTLVKENREFASCVDAFSRRFDAVRYFTEKMSIHELVGKASQVNARELVDVHVNAPYLNSPMTVDLSTNIKLDDADIPIDRFIYEVYYKQKDCELWIRPNKQEPCALGEIYRKNTNLLKNETLLNGIVMRPQTFFDRFITENVETLEMPNKAVYERFIERMLSWDDENAQIGKNVLYNVDCGINFSRTWSGKKSFYENIIANSVKSNHVTLPRVENFIGVSASRIAANPNGVLSDIFVRADEMSEADFRRLADHPSGYNYFSPFKVGEYEYKDALYRIKIKKDNGVANPLIYDYKINVDIDDVKDRGTVDIPAEETKVYFNRSYYTEPDVVVNVVSGEEGKVIIPFIISTDGEDDRGRYFTIILKDTAGNPVSGTISWNSNGY